MSTTILTGDCRDVLPTLEAGSVRCCVTSPPYWGLRDYGHERQIGLERTPEEYVAAIVGVFREVRRVLADDGTLWLNLGDCYAAARGGTTPPAETLAGGHGGWMPDGSRTNRDRKNGYNPTRDAAAIGLKHKDLVGIPWRVAFALQADGWYLRSDIIWSKPNPMPESVTDRPTKAHEYLFLLSKRERYYYDGDAIKEPVQSGPSDIKKMIEKKDRIDAKHFHNDPGALPAANPRTNIGKKRGVGSPEGRNRRTVWTVATQPYSGAHFATFPPALIEPCILAGSAAGDAVLDPFGGSGTTAMVAQRLGRRAVVIEINPAYVTLADERTAGTMGLAL